MYVYMWTWNDKRLKNVKSRMAVISLYFLADCRLYFEKLFAGENILYV